MFGKLSFFRSDDYQNLFSSIDTGGFFTDDWKWCKVVHQGVKLLDSSKVSSLSNLTYWYNTNYTLMDKNKSAYKLKNFGPLYIINLDGQPERWDWMKSQLDYWGVDDYTRVSAYDGREDDLSEIIYGQYPIISSGEVGCVTSHLKAIKHWMETSDSPYAVFMEDDCDLETVKYWLLIGILLYPNSHTIGIVFSCL